MFNLFSVRAKLTLSITLIILGITGGLTFLSVHKDQKSHEHDMTEKGELFLDSIDVLLRNSLYSLDVNTVVRSVEQFREHQTLIETVCVFDADGRLLIESTQGNLTLEAQPDIFGVEIINHQGYIYQQYDDYLLAAKPIRFGEKTVGGIAIKLSKNNLQEKINTVRVQGLLIAIFAVSGGVIITLFISYSVTVPLNQLVKATKRITEGDLSYRIDLKNKSEFSLLAKEFNKMSDWLEETLQKYQESNTQLQHDLFHDNLTGLSNRVHIIQEIEKAINRKKGNNDYNFSLLFLDCDRFKVINDSLGHDVGDQVLVNLAERLNLCIRKDDIAARLGGDEFVILINNISDVEQVTQIADRILEKMSQPLILDNQQLVITMSIGVVMSQENYKDADDLLRDADVTMYHAKQKGKAQYAIFKPIMHTEALERLKVENGLRKALEKKEFHLYYQPIISLTTSQLIGFEALLRWHHPTQGWISPGSFIPVAEETGLIVPLGEWVLQEACRQISVWQSHFTFSKPLKISVNISSYQLNQSEFVAQVQRVLKETEIKASQLNLEITETVIMDNIESVCFKLQCLQKLGVKVSIDDFGTGYSSLNYLQQLPIDILKIDRSFVSRLESHPTEFRIIEAIIKLGNILGMETLAEGIETLEQYNLIKSLGVNYAQGYLFSKPLNVNSVEQILYSLFESASLAWKSDDYLPSIFR
ncbi:EAL domain-containing protein [Crocosphaera sp.]|uniref:EAL domain-containing protein n=1 Tax=Crocosphaera sp. TaxID=2729996 RepID=UPI00261164A3|nr:EAL domain-containing protein [Crocosphaera sp.]MDJ0580837.1 EAL domain-containing protein [Crocosphaera sp.]